jgi:hypothetical protein
VGIVCLIVGVDAGFMQAKKLQHCIDQQSVMPDRRFGDGAEFTESSRNKPYFRGYSPRILSLKLGH